MLRKKINSEYLHYGCELSFSQLDNGFISSSGFINSNLYLSPPCSSTDFSNSLFRVLPLCIHNIQNDLLTSLESSSLAEYQNTYSRLAENLQGELKTNLQTYEKLKGESIRFGSCIYLQHCKSHKFLTIVPNATGVVERDNLKVCLSEFPSDYSCVKIEPIYNFQKEGDGFVRVNDIILLEIFLNDLNKPAYINSSIKGMLVDAGDSGSDSSIKEINASLDKKVKWRVNIYDSLKSDRKKTLTCGDCIWIAHTEGGVVLKSLFDNEKNYMYFNDNQADSNALWKIEGENDHYGGSVYTEKAYRLRHLSSGRYLSVNIDSENSQCSGGLTGKDDPRSLWLFESIYEWKKQSKIELHQFFHVKNVESQLRMQGISDEYTYTSVKLGFSEGNSEASYFKLFKADVSVLWETRFVISCVEVVRGYQNSLVWLRSERDIAPYTILKIFKKKSELMNVCLQQLDLFLQHKLKSSFSIGKKYGQVDKSRQKIFCELMLFDYLSNILDSCFTGDFALFKVAKINRGGLQSNSKTNITEEIPLLVTQQLIETARIVYQVMITACQGNAENQKYSFKFFHIFQKHAGYELGATSCMSSILRNNEELLVNLQRTTINLETGVKYDSIIDHYIWLLRVRNI